MKNYEEELDQIINNFDQITEKYQKINYLEKEMENFKNYITRPEGMEAKEMKAQDEAMENYLRKGVEVDMERKEMSTGDDEGGLLIQPQLTGQIHNIVKAKSTMRNLATVQRISTSMLDYLIEDGQMSSGWIGEKESRSVTETSSIKKKRILVHELYAQPKATARLLDDSQLNVQNWLAERVADSFVKKENAAFLNGDGDKKPNGLLKCADINILEVNNGPTVDTLLELIANLDEEYLQNASFLMNRGTLNKIQSLKDNQGRFIWQPSLSDPMKNTILGVPVSVCSNMPDSSEGNIGIAFGDFKQTYSIVDRSDISIMRDPYTEKPFVKFYSTKRVGGDVTNPNAMLFAKFKA